MLKQVLVVVTLIVSNVVALQLFEERIFGGKEARPGQFPHQVSLRVFHRNRYHHICGGSIISDRFILTAAHCYLKEVPKASRYRIVVGSHSNGGDDGRAYDVRKFTIHEGRDPVLKIHDIGLIEVIKKIVFGNNVAPIRLHRKFIDGVAHAVTSGWGRTNNNITNLKFANVKTMSNTECRRRLANRPDAHIHNFSTLCAFSGRKGTGVCNGDSGGPLVYNNELIGITSWGYACAVGLPDGFARVSPYIDWIDARIGSTGN